MDLSKLSVADDATTVVEIFDLAGDKTDITITILSSDSEAVRKVVRAQEDRRYARASRSRSMTVRAKELEAERCEVAAAATKAWTNVELGGRKGDDFPCNMANAMEAYKAAPALLEQVQAAMNDRTLFPKS